MTGYMCRDAVCTRCGQLLFERDGQWRTVYKVTETGLCQDPYDGQWREHAPDVKGSK